MSDETVSVTEYSRRRGVSHEAVRKAVKVGRLSKSVVFGPTGKARLIPDIADQEWIANTDSAQQRVPAVPPPRPVAPDPEVAAPEQKTATFQQARTMREAYMARLAKLEFDEKAGQLVRADAVKNEAFKVARVVRDSLLNIPDRVAAELANETNQFKVHQRLTQEIRRALEDMRIDQ
jgi:hypothetical protein